MPQCRIPTAMTSNPRTTRESVIERYLVQQAEAHGGLAIKLRPPNGRGFPDRTLTMPRGVVFFVETKRPVGGVLSAQQMYWRDRLLAMGCFYFICITTEEVDALFASYVAGDIS